MEIDIRFTPERREQCEKALRRAHDLVPLLEKLNRCGLDCTQLEEMRATYAAQLEAWRNEFKTLRGS